MGEIIGEGGPVTAARVDAWHPNLSPDGKKLVFWVNRAGKGEL